MSELFFKIKDGDWFFPIPIHFGLNSSDRTRKIAEQYGIKKPLIVSDKNLVRLPFAEKIFLNLKETRQLYLYSVILRQIQEI